MKRLVICLFVFMGILGLSGILKAESVYELRKLTEDEWLDLSTEERLTALGTAYKQTENQTFVGDFGWNYDLYKKWGYNFYEMEDRYESYAFRWYENYEIIENRRRRWSYNEFGDRIEKMGASYTLWNELYRGDDTFNLTMQSGYLNSVVTGTRDTRPFLDGVWVLRESTNDWTVSAIAAGALRTKYSPLSINIPNIDGMRIDFESANNSVSLLTGSLLEWGDMAAGGVMVRGGYFRRKFGVLTLGATYANEYIVQGTREKGSQWDGTLNDSVPTPLILALRVLDDSPRDTDNGPIIYNMRLEVDGKYRDDILPTIILDDVTRDKVTAITSTSERGYLDPGALIYGNTEAKLDFFSLFETIPKYADYLYYRDLHYGYNLTNATKNFSKELGDTYYKIVEPGGKPIQVKGTECAVYLFDVAGITSNVRRMEVAADIANDYRIQTSMIYTVSISGGHTPDGKNESHYDPQYWTTTAQADGNVKDGSNRRTVKIDFGYQVASINYGFDMDFNYRGFRINGEYMTNSNHYMYPDGIPGTGEPEFLIPKLPPRKGHRYSVIDNSYYVTTQKNWGKFGFAGEIFKMGKFYRPYMDYYVPRSKLICYQTRNRSLRIPLIEDNDDDDMYPDTMTQQRTYGYRVLSTEDPDGVFPGNDEDKDGIADNNKNSNGIPDYDEAFLMFDIDSDLYVFGNDYNNNTIPDFREDDMKLDTPYNLDRQGQHIYFRFTPQRSVNLLVGSMRTNGVGVDNRTNDDYFKFLMDYDVFGVGKLYAEYRYEEIQDNIHDPYMQVSNISKSDILIPGITGARSRFERAQYFDELEYLNSKVHRLWLDSRIRAIPSITLENHIKFESNRQVEGTMYDSTFQPYDVLNTLAMVNKIVYTKRWGDFVFSPGVKFRLYKKARLDLLQPLHHNLTRIPLVMFKYIFSPQTDIMFGMQGVPGFELQMTDYVQDRNNFKQKNYILQIQNKTTYFGYNIWASAGFEYTQRYFENEYRKFEEFKTSSTFVKVNLGWD